MLSAGIAGVGHRRSGDVAGLWSAVVATTTDGVQTPWQWEEGCLVYPMPASTGRCQLFKFQLLRNEVKAALQAAYAKYIMGVPCSHYWS